MMYKRPFWHFLPEQEPNNEPKADNKQVSPSVANALVGRSLYEEYFRFPLKLKYGIEVMTSDFCMAFDFAHEWAYDNIFKISPEDRESIVRILNGEDAKIEGLGTLSYTDEAEIRVNGQPFIIIRSWGRLTGIGGYNLPSEEAIKIQDDFAQFIIKRLNECR